MNDIMIQVCMRESQLERNFAVSIVLAVPAFHMIAAIRAQAWYLIRWVYAGFMLGLRCRNVLKIAVLTAAYR